MVSMFVYRCLKSKIVIAVSLSIELPPLASKNSHRRIWKSSIKYLSSKSCSRLRLRLNIRKIFKLLY